MGKKAILLFVVTIALSGIVFYLPESVEAKTIHVPNQYPTITAAIANSNNGDTIRLSKGTYEGTINQTLVIEKSISIIGEGPANTKLKLYPAYNQSWILTQQFFSYSDAIAINADDCKLQDLTISAEPGGSIKVTGDRTQIINVNVTTEVIVDGSYCYIAKNICNRFQLSGTFSEITKNNIYAIVIVGSSNNITENICLRMGIINSTKNIVSNNILTSPYRYYDAISLSRSSNNLIHHNQIAGYGSGIKLWHSSNNHIVANTISNSSKSINLAASSNNKIFQNNIVEKNAFGDGYIIDQYTDGALRYAYPDMTASVNIWDNGKQGNHWGDYNGNDENGDGVGDSPYIIKHTYFEAGEDKEFICGQDNFPLMDQVAINAINVNAAEWANASNSSSPSAIDSQEQPPLTMIIAALIGVSIILVIVSLVLLHNKSKKALI
jgi:parallel beta-helix repeat protein